MKMFKVHLIDDDPRFEQQVKSALFPHGQCDELIEFQHFPTVGAAIKNYENGEASFPDVALVDVRFEEPGIPEEEKGPLKGFKLIKHFAEFAPERTKMYVFTAFVPEDPVAETIEQLDLFGKTIEKGTQIGAQVRIRVQRELQKKAINILKGLAQNYRNELAALPDRWAICEVPNTGFLLPQLLAGWGDVRTKSRDEVQEIVGEILSQEAGTTQFIGNWRKHGSAEQNELYLYKNLPRAQYERRLKYINKKAFDLMLELINVNYSYIEQGDDHFTATLSHDYSGFSVTKTLRDNEEAFSDKLVGRRAMLAIDTYVDRRRGLELEDLAYLLRDCELNMKQKIANCNPQIAVFNTNLGLAIERNGLLRTHDSFMLPEEKDFLTNLGIYAPDFANFLANIHVAPALLPHLQGNNLQNMTALKRFADNVINAGHPPEILKNLTATLFNSKQLVNVEALKRRTIFNLFGISV